jgi:hypothetical protein
MFFVDVLQQGNVDFVLSGTPNHEQENNRLITQSQGIGITIHGLSSDVPSANLGQRIAILRFFPLCVQASAGTAL